jgi:hypothetical protein
MSEKQITLTFSIKDLTDFCRRQIDRSANPGHALAALTSLQAFIGKHAPPDVAVSQEYTLVRDSLDRFLSETRERLLNEHGSRLLKMLQEQDIAGIASLHGELSRSGFQQTAERTLSRVATTERNTLLHWSQEWVNDAIARAQAASSYPDAPDFKAAGIDYREYISMMDTVTALTNAC